MPVHDWTTVVDGIFHAFHHFWIGEIAGALNAGLLPREFYCLPEQVTGPVGPDVLTLQGPPRRPAKEAEKHGGTMATLTPPRVRFTGTLGNLRQGKRKPKSAVIRHTTNDRVIAIIEVVSPGNKSSQSVVRTFLDKATTIISRGIHLLLIDLLPPGKRDPQGLHSLIAAEFGEPPFVAPEGQPLILASYTGNSPTSTYVEALGVGDPIPDMPLFLEQTQYVNVPLEATYQSAWVRMPERWQEILQPANGGAPE